jgi:hypothetical protein
LAKADRGIAEALTHDFKDTGITAERYLHEYSDRDVDAADPFGRLVG